MNIASGLKVTGMGLLFGAGLSTANKVLCDEVPAIRMAEFDLIYDRCDSQKNAKIAEAIKNIRNNKAAILEEYDESCSRHACPEVGLGEIIDTELGRDIYYCSSEKFAAYKQHEGVMASTLSKNTRAILFYEASFFDGECQLEGVVLHETIHTATGIGHINEHPDWIYDADVSTYIACIIKTLPPALSPVELLTQP